MISLMHDNRLLPLIKNPYRILENASETGLPDQGLDLAFLFGLPRVEGGRPSLLKELARTIKPGGAVVLQKSRTEEQALVQEMSAYGFTLRERKGRMLVFQS
jgi:ubiquinone/menaquinone biosynthesis C-methylase UbiE